MVTPEKHEILSKAKSIAMERQIRAGLPAITPSEVELKESGTFHEAQIDLMQVDQEALSEQRRYLEEMAGDLRLKIIPVKGLATLKRETGFEWTNGWTKHEKRKPRKKPANEYRVVIGETLDSGARLPSLKQAEHQIQTLRLKRPTLRKMKIVKVRKGRFQDVKAEMSITPKPKRKKRHVERSGKTMRALRKVNGVKVFAFPDSVWKVRKPRKKRRRK